MGSVYLQQLGQQGAPLWKSVLQNASNCVAWKSLHSVLGISPTATRLDRVGVGQSSTAQAGTLALKATQPIGSPNAIRARSIRIQHRVKQCVVVVCRA